MIATGYIRVSTANQKKKDHPLMIKNRKSPKESGLMAMNYSKFMRMLLFLEDRLNDQLFRNYYGMLNRDGSRFCTLPSLIVWEDQQGIFSTFIMICKN